MIFTFTALKGGEGKTTLAINLLDQYIQRGLNVCLVDADQSQNSYDFLFHRTEKLCDFYKFESKEQVLKLNEVYDLVIIDNSNRINNLLNEVLEVTDFIIIPSKLSSLSNFTLADLLKKIYSIGKEKQTGIVFNCVRHTKIKQKNAQEEYLKEKYPEIYVFKNKISLSSHYENSINQLKTLREIKSNKVAEIQFFLEELEEV